MTVLTSDKIAIIGTFFTGIAVLIAFYTLYDAVRKHQSELQQTAAQTREVLKEIISDCNLFLRPLNQIHPYPILHTATAITKEFCSHLGTSPQREDILSLIENKVLLLSICIDGWVSSSQMIHLMEIVDKVERTASSYNLQGKLELIREEAFVLASLVTEICSPDSFYRILSQIELPKNRNNKDLLDIITIEMQMGISEIFNDYKEVILRNIYFIQTAANMFINLTDKQLRHLSKAPNNEYHDFSVSKGANLNNLIEDAIVSSEHENSSIYHFQKVLLILEDIREDIGGSNYMQLSKLIELLSKDKVWEGVPTDIV